MTETVVRAYDSSEKLQNAREDLVVTGIPQEKILIDEKANKIQVTIPDATSAEVIEILERHGPNQAT